MKINWENKTALVTGASSGIGAAIARRLAAEGLHVILVARREERLRAVQQEIARAGGKAEIAVADLSSAQERERIFAQVTSAFGPPDVLINNAGMGWYGYYADMPWALAAEILRVNVEAVMHFTTLFLPGMLKKGWGRVVNVGSIIGSIPSQGTAMYSSTKAFLDNFSTVLYRETRGSGVEVCLVRPGQVQTDFFTTAEKRGDMRYPNGNSGGATADSVAASVWRLLQHPRRVAHVPGWARLSNLLEPLTGWIQDQIGPVDLKRQKMTGR
jgi:uncharacterized protein